MIARVRLVCTETNKLGAEVIEQRLNKEKRICVSSAGNDIDSNVRLFIQLFHFIDILQLQQGTTVESLPHNKPVWMLSNVGTIDGSVAPQAKVLDDIDRIHDHIVNNNPDMVVACRNHSVLTLAVPEFLTQIHLLTHARQRKAAHLSNCVLGMTNRIKDSSLLDSRLAVYMVPNRLPRAVIFVHRTADMDPINAINPVALGFLVVEPPALQQVQGLLLLMGEATINAPDAVNKLTRLQTKFKELQQHVYQKADVEKYLTWKREGPRTALPALPNTWNTVSMVEEWQFLREVFQKLEIYSSYEGTCPVASCSWDNPPRSTMFKTLRIYEYSSWLVVQFKWVVTDGIPLPPYPLVSCSLLVPCNAQRQ